MSDRPERASIDLTLLFGAESYLLQEDDADPNADPWRIHAFRRFVDVLLSGVEVYFPLPPEPDSVTRLVSSRLARSVSFGQFRLCATPLNAKTEEAVVRGFSTFLEHPQKRLDLAKWLRFQMHPSRVEGQIHEKREPITDDSNAAWDDHRVDFLARAANLQGLPSDNVIQKSYHVHGRSPREFALLYAFDIYRRGWQYARFAGENAAAYFPHEFRIDCLDQHDTVWQTISQMESGTYSWSRYFVTLVRDKPEYRNVARIVSLLERLGDALQERPLRPWLHLDLARLEHGPAFTRSEIDALVATLNDIVAVAERAKLPVLRIPPPAWSRPAVAAATEVGKKLLEETVKWLAWPIFAVDLVLSVLKSMPASEVWIDEHASSLLRGVSRGDYDYTGLVPHHVSSFHELFEPTY